METEKIIEGSVRSTSGLTSAMQVVDITDSASFSISNTTCALPEHLQPIVPSKALEPQKTEFQGFGPLLSRKEKFRKALEVSMRKNKSILKELAKY